MSDNMYNTYRQRNNSTGVRKHIQKGKYISYQAYISINNKQINLGYFGYGLLCNIVVLKVIKDEEK